MSLLATLELPAARRETAFDEAVGNLGPERMLEALVASLADTARTEAAELLPASFAQATYFRVNDMLEHGRGGFWLMSQWMLANAPKNIRKAPHPAHERWDVLVEANKAHPEAAWVIASLFVASEPSLARRILLGVERRFGSRGLRIVSALATDDAHRGIVEGLVEKSAQDATARTSG